MYQPIANQLDLTFSKSDSVIGQLSSTSCHSMVDSLWLKASHLELLVK